MALTIFLPAKAYWIRASVYWLWLFFCHLPSCARGNIFRP